MSFEQKQYWLKGRDYEYFHILRLLEEECTCDPDDDFCIAAEAIDLIKRLESNHIGNNSSTKEAE